MGEKRITFPIRLEKKMWEKFYRTVDFVAFAATAVVDVLDGERCAAVGV